MSDKYLTVKEWQKFAKGAGYKDAAFVKALAATEKAEHAVPQDQLKVLYELEEDGRALLKQHKGDKKLESYLEDVNKALKKYRKDAEKAVDELAEQEAEEGVDNDSPVLLQHKMIPLLRDVKKGVEMHALIGLSGKDAVVLLSKRSIAPTRRELLMKWLGASGGVKWIKGVCLFEENAHTFVVQGAAAGLARKLKAALLAQVELRLKVRVRGEDPNDIDEDLSEADADPDGPPQAGGPDQRAAYEQTKKALYPRISAAVRDGVPEKDRIVRLMGLAQKAEGAQDWAGGIALYAQLAELLGGAPGAAAGTSAPGPDAGDLQARYAARTARLTPLALAALKAQQGDVAKIRAVAEFAREKGASGHHKAALAALDALEKLLPAASTASATAAPPGTDAAAPGAQVAFTQTRLDWDRTRKSVQAELRKLENELLAICAEEPDFDEIRAGTVQLYEILEVLDERLIDKLDDALNAAEPERRRARHGEAREIIDEYLDFVNTDPLMRDIDRNGFIDVKIQSALTERLQHMAQQLGASYSRY